jgi:hypothetical protein
LLAIGIVLLMLTRPYEGMLLCLPVAAWLAHRIFYGKRRPPLAILMRRAAFPLLLVIGAGAWLGYYDYRAFGKATTLPYTVDRATYAVAPYYLWQAERPTPKYRHEIFRIFYAEASKGELDFYRQIHSSSSFISQTLRKAWSIVVFFAGGALLIPLIMLRRVLLDRRIRLLLVCIFVLAAGMAIEIFVLPHYVAPFTAAFYAIGIQGMRHLRLWKFEGKPVGATLVRLAVVLCVLSAGIRLFAEPVGIKLHPWPAHKWNWAWYGPGHFGTERARIAGQLQHMPGDQLVLVRYSADHEPLNEWVYNDADIDASKVIWAREMNPADDRELIGYYHDRKVWLVEPDTSPARVTPYPLSDRFGVAAFGTHAASSREGNPESERP